MATHKDVDPQGFLLNDNDTGVDHLGEFTFADAIADSIHQVDTPITIGLFARWGSGKSFLLRHLESILKKYQKQDEVDDGQRKNNPVSGGCTRSSMLRTLKWFSCVVVIFAVMICTLILATQPGLFLPPKDEIPPAYIVYSLDDTTTTAPTTVAHDDPEMSVYQILKIVGMVLIPIEILIVFILGCCGNTWLAKGYYGSFRLICYGTFTKLPIRNPREDIVEDPGQHPADVLKHIKPGDERLAIAASGSTAFSRRYIFVDFKAWEYAGSDSLWAGIVTKLSDAIELEFGVITARLFRMLVVQEIPRSVLDGKERTIYIDLGKSSDRDIILETMKQYGVVTSCEKFADLDSDRARWKIIYSNDGELRNAMDCLGIEGVPCHTQDPREAKSAARRDHFVRGERLRESEKHLIQSGNDIEMTDMNIRINNSPTDSTVLDRAKSSARTPCCSRFWSHFSRYPVMLLCLPRLVWWILISLCCFLIPITVHIIASELNLEVYQTYRPVPLISQVLLWLPASAAVSVVGCRFFWAMCHSQRQRINKALDGTKAKMAEQLGFMDKVKNEVEVITNLIHCARFTHQRDYKVFITIDDLDRVPLTKVKSVLEAVSILLSDKLSPFICIIAVDPRIVVKSIEQSSAEVLLKAKVSGHEYLKKIINLPVCLPEIGESGKKRFIAGLIDQADHTITYRANVELENELTTDHPDDRMDTLDRPRPMNSQRAAERRKSVDSLVVPDNDTVDSANNSVDEMDETNYTVGDRPSALVHFEGNLIPVALRANQHKKSKQNQRIKRPQIQITVPEELDHKAFSFACRKFVYHDADLHNHLQGNPRNIKRIFNVISLTTSIINSLVKKQQRRKFISENRPSTNLLPNTQSHSHSQLVRTEEFAKNLVRWIVLTDQWPYRTSFILQVIEDADQRSGAGLVKENLPDEWSILQIFQDKVLKEFPKNIEDDDPLMVLDGDPDLFYSYLHLLEESGFTKRKMIELEKYTVNLDYSIRHSIALGRDLSFMDAQHPQTPNLRYFIKEPSTSRRVFGKKKTPSQEMTDQNEENYAHAIGFEGEMVQNMKPTIWC